MPTRWCLRIGLPTPCRFDLLTCKAHGLKTYLFIQSLFTLFFLDGLRPQLVDMPCCYELADGVVCLNDTDRFVWSQFNPNTFVTQNPITMPPTGGPRRLKDMRSSGPHGFTQTSAPSVSFPLCENSSRWFPMRCFTWLAR